jgi:hypothetical protein
MNRATRKPTGRFLKMDHTADEPAVVLPYRGRPDARARRSTSDLFAGVVALLVLATSLTGLIGAQLAALGGWFHERRELYAVITVMSLVLAYWSYRVARAYFQGPR